MRLVQEHVSTVDGTIKRVYQLQPSSHDSTSSSTLLIESVLMGPYRDGRYTACISSQVGCAQGCVFCATGQMGFTRQLSATEIFEQVAIFQALLVSSSSSSESTNAVVTHGKSKRLSNVVFMGMGEVRNMIHICCCCCAKFHCHMYVRIVSHLTSSIYTYSFWVATGKL